MPKVLIADKLDKNAIAVFEQNNIDYEIKTGLCSEDLIKAAKDADGIVIRSNAIITKEILEALPKLKVVGRAGIGVDNVDVEYATSKGVIVMNTPFGNTITTAEHTIAMMMSLARNLPLANQLTKENGWPKSKCMGIELFDKTLGIIGCGNIGAIVASRAVGLKMKVIAFDPFLSNEKAENLGIEKVELEDIFAKSDIITLHTPANEKTKGMINKNTIAKMKDGVRIINCARGSLVVSEDLVEAVKSGKVAGAAVDVYEEEPAKDHIFFKEEKIFCTPHLGASTIEAQEKVSLQIAEQISAFLKEGIVSNAVNMPSISAEESLLLKPYLKICADIASLVGQTLSGAIKSINIEYAGEAAKLNLKPLTATVLKHIFSHITENVNMVNAGLIAKEKGIEIIEAKRFEIRSYKTSITVKVTTQNGDFSASGTLLGGQAARIVAINDVKLEAEVSPNMIYINSKDKPGMIAKISRIIADNNLNIATLSLGRNLETGYATSLINVDEEVQDSIINDICAVDGIKTAISLKF